MRIELLTSIAGPAWGYDAGAILDWPDAAEARRLVAAGLARAVPAPAPAPPPLALEQARLAQPGRGRARIRARAPGLPA